VFFSLTIPPDKHKPEANVQIVISSQYSGAKTSVLKACSASFALSLRTVSIVKKNRMFFGRFISLILLIF